MALPYVALGENGRFSVTIDSDDRMRQAIYYLASLGHRKIAYKGTNSLFDFTFNRYHGYLDGIRKYGIDEGSLFVSSMCQPIEELARLCVETLLKKRQGTVVPTLSLLPVTYGYGGTTRRES